MDINASVSKCMAQCGYSLCRETLEHYPEAVVDLFVDEREKNKAYSNAKSTEGMQITENGRMLITEASGKSQPTGIRANEPSTQCVDSQKDATLGKKRFLEQRIDAYLEEIEQLEFEGHTKLEALQKRHDFEKTEIENGIEKMIKFKKARIAKLDEMCTEIFM